jgi:hypothetical protein
MHRIRLFHVLFALSCLALGCQGEGADTTPALSSPGVKPPQGSMTPIAAPAADSTGQAVTSAPTVSTVPTAPLAPLEVKVSRRVTPLPPAALVIPPAPLPAVPADAAPAASARLSGGAAPSALADLSKRIDAHFTAHPSARIYIQSDKPLYNPGESIWVQIWDLQAKDLAGTQQEGVWLELINPRGEVTNKLKLKLDGGVAPSAIDLPDDAPGGEYLLRVRHFTVAGQPSVITSRTIVVNRYEPPRVKKTLEFQRKAYGPGDEVAADVTATRPTGEPLAGLSLRVQVRLDGEPLPEATFTTDDQGRGVARFTLPHEITVGDVVMTVLIDDGGLTESISRRVPVTLKAIDLALYPEGGDLIQGLPSRVYFEARKPTTGKPADVEGDVIDEGGRVVSTFSSVRDGLGRFDFTPEPGHTYKARIHKPVGVTAEVALPDAQASGCVLRSFDDLDGAERALRVAVRCTSAQDVSVVAIQGERVIDAAAVAVPAADQAVVYLDPADSPIARAPGAARVTVFNAKSEPLAERLIFRNRRERLTIQVTPDAPRYQPGDPVSLRIHTQTPDGVAVPATLALAVVDDTVLSYADDKTGHILSRLLLEPELQGEIEDPNFFLDLSEDKAALALDLLMGTRGWRRFDWAPVLASALPTTPTPDTTKPAVDPDLHADHPDPTKTPRVVDHPAQPPQPQPANPQPVAQPSSDAMPAAIAKAQSNNTHGNINNILADIPAPDEIALVPGFAGDFRGDDFGSFGGGVGGGKGFGGLASGEAALGGQLREQNMNRPVLRPADPKIAGGFDKQIVKRVINQKRSEITHCYNKELMKNPALNGKVTMKWTITPSGDIGAVVVEANEMGNDAVATCLRGRIAGWKFPQPKGGGNEIISYPFIFDTTGGGGTPEHERVSWAPARVFAAPSLAADAGATRTDFRETIFWAANVKTDAKGEAEVKFALSDAVTSFRVTTEGVGGVSGGLALPGRDEAVISSSRLFSMEVKLPVEVSAGDIVLLPLTFTNNTPDAATASLSADFGAHLVAAAQDLDSTTLLAASSRETVFFPLRVRDAEGESVLRFDAAAGDRTDALSQPLRVTKLGFPATRSLGGVLSKDSADVAHTLDLSAAVEGSTQARLVVEVDPMSSVTSALEGMLQEPGGCFEQTSSSNYPNTLVLSYLDQVGAATSDTRARALGLIDRGYKRLVSFESPSHGFEWFGKDPGHLALTAFGVLQFTDMQRVYGGVDAAMLARTTRWLLERRDGMGHFKPTSAQTLHTWDSGPVIDAYTTYSLTEAGVLDGLDAELQAQLALARATEDPYVLALAAATLFNLPQHAADAQAAAKRLASMQRPDGRWDQAKTSATASRGADLIVETTALAITALIDSGAHPEAVRAGIAYLFTQRRGGAFGATQATLLSIKALLRYAASLPPVQPSADRALEVLVNGQVVQTVSLPDTSMTPLSVDLSPHVTSKSQDVRLRYTGENTRPVSYFVSADFRTARPEDSAASPVAITADLSAQTVKMGESVRLTVKLTNTSDAAVPMVVARVGIPGGLNTQLWQLKELKEAAVLDFYETRPREVTLYFSSLEAKQEVVIPVELSADIPGHFSGPASRAYLYYGGDAKRWADPVVVDIVP